VLEFGARGGEGILLKMQTTWAATLRWIIVFLFSPAMLILNSSRMMTQSEDA